MGALFMLKQVPSLDQPPGLEGPPGLAHPFLVFQTRIAAMTPVQVKAMAMSTRLNLGV